MSQRPRSSIGIDLGTSNSAVAVCDFESGALDVLDVPQIVGAGRVAGRSTLPSAIYLPHPDEFPAGSLRLPWMEADPEAITGIFARTHGAMVPDRLVTSAKSWLCHVHTDPRKPVLPWGSTIPEKHYSALEASRLLLGHLREALVHSRPAESLGNASLVITVPASFDEAARNLTLEAANQAGFKDVVLLEEPQAAFYAWTENRGSDWRKQVAPGELALVCDIGGGTADFSLIAVTERNGTLELERVAVGEHILLGGDNMDLALAYTLQAELEAAGRTLDEWQFLSLIHGASQAKVALFSDPSLAEAPIAIPSRGSSLFAKSIPATLRRELLESVVIEGFFPLTGPGDFPEPSQESGLQEFGLPYASDPVVSKHLARFLARALQNVKGSTALQGVLGDSVSLEGTFLRPTAVLFNGGVFKATPLRQRILALLTSWGDGPPVRELEGDEPDLAVARGAAIYGRNRATGKGIRIKSGTARSYYIGLKTSMPAIPGFKPPIKALCVAPQGMEEGSEILIEGQEFGLVVGQPAEFRFFASEVRSGDQPGQVIPNALKELEETNRIQVTLPAVSGFPEGQPVPVQINPLVTELGNLELWMKHLGSGQRWKLEFQVRLE